MGEVIELFNALTVEKVAFSLANRIRRSKLPVVDIMFDETLQAIRIIMWNERNKVESAYHRSYFVGMDLNRDDGRYYFSFGMVDSKSKNQITLLMESDLADWAEFYNRWDFTIRRLHRECVAEDFLFDPATPARISIIPPDPPCI